MLPLLVRYRHTLFWGTLLIIIGTLVLTAGIIAPHDPLRQNLAQRFAAPGSMAADSSRYLLGTDNLGRDLLSRTLHGGRPSLFIALCATAIGMIIGTALGLFTYLRTLNHPIMMAMDIILGFPALLFAMLIASVARNHILSIIITLGILYIPVFARLTHTKVKGMMQEQFIIAAKVQGASAWRIIMRHIVPNILTPLAAESALVCATAILIASSLSFLGIGVQPPAADWGLMLKSAYTYLYQSVGMALFPGIALFLTIFCLNRFADTLQHH